MLRLRDWADIEGMRVDRKDMEALRVAQDLQVEGAVRAEDTSFMYDSTPAANKVDRAQIDGGNMVNVIRDALEIRQGKRSEDGEPKALNGAQTSAAMMASDFLLEELDRIVSEYPGEQRAPILEDREEDEQYSVTNRRPRSAMASGGYAAAYGFDADDYDEGGYAGNLSFSSGQELEDAEISVLFGGGGILTANPDDEYPRGMDLLRNF